MKSEFVIIADDLSGGMNIGVEFAVAGLHTVLVQHADDCPQADVLIVDTATRNAPADVAYRSTRQAAQAAKLCAPEIVVKKIDSLLRGSIWPEIKAVREVFGFERCLLLAASPKLKRTTINGDHYIDGRLLESVRHEVDPSSQSDGSYIPAVLGDPPVTLLTIDLIRQGTAAVEASIRQATTFLLVADCTSQAELNTVVSAAYAADIRFFAGTYGLGEALCKLSRPDPHPILVVVGSLSAAAQQQVDYLRRESGCVPIQVDYNPPFFDTPIAEIAGRYQEALQAALNQPGACVIFQLSVSADKAQGVWQRAAERGLDQVAVSTRIDRLMAMVLEPVLPDCGGFVATGGATANTLFQLLKADGLALDAAEVLPGTPGARLIGGIYDGLSFIAKPGSQGDADALARLVDYSWRVAIRL